jgi:hypothetical protein
VNPIVVGGSGGSGTRAVARFLARNGVAMGRCVTEAGDAHAFVDVLEALISPILEATGSLDYGLCAIPVDLRTRALKMITLAVDRHRGSSTGCHRWGFKNPRQMFILPLLLDIFPDLIFVHVVRDGRDMLLSANQNQPRKHYTALFGEPNPGGHQASARFWGTVNLQAAICGERTASSGYVPVRIEDLCGKDREYYVRRLAARIGLSQSHAITQSDVFKFQTSFGRGKAHDDGFSDLPTIFNQALAHFGYG